MYLLTLDRSNDIKGIAQLLIFISNINDNFEITEEFWPWNPLRGKCRERTVGVIKRHKLPWSTLTNITMDGSPNLTGKNVGLLK